MSQGFDQEALKKEIEDLVEKRISSVFRRYGLDTSGIVTQLKWRPAVLVIGNYSSGKSTFINELLGSEVQRTGQSPTDDSFTILTAPGPEETEGLVPGSSVIGNDSLPFGTLRRFGERLVSHLQMKRLHAPILKDIAIIDTPGMLDSVTERDRGYDYLGVIGEIAGFADLIILMFDPHKAGTIKETYQAIRGTLPGATGEERVLYVLNRIDECENVPDLVRAYGTLCWNLSQMTGRKDIPRIFLTFSPTSERIPRGIEVWAGERDELKRAVLSAPRMRLSHILQEVDKALRGAEMVVEAMASWKNRFWKGVIHASRYGLLAAAGSFLTGDLLLKILTGFPENTLLGCLLGGGTGPDCLTVPSSFALGALILTVFYIQRFLYPKLRNQAAGDPDNLVTLDTPHRQDIWRRVRGAAERLLERDAMRQVWLDHGRARARLRDFIEKDLARFHHRLP